MTTWLYVLPQQTDDLAAQPCWVIRVAQGVTSISLGDCAAVLAGEAVKVLLPMERFSWHLCAPWRHRRKPGTEALLFEVEEQLLQPLETLRAWRGRCHEDGRHELWVADRQAYQALMDRLRAALPRLVSVHIDGDLFARHQPGALWLAGRWLVGGEGGPRLAASDAWLSELEQTSNQPVARLQGPDETWDALETAKGLDLLEKPGKRQGWPWALTAASVLGAFGLVCAAEYRMGSALAEGNLALARRNEQRLAQLYPGQAVGPEALARLSAAAKNFHQGKLGPLVALLQRLDAVPGVRIHTIERGPEQRWRLSVSAEHLEDIHLERRRWRMLNMTAEGGRWQGTLEDIGS